MKSDIFFFVATIATVVVAAFLAVAIYYLVRFLKKANRISDSVEDGIDQLKEGVKDQPFLNFLFKKKKTKKQKQHLVHIVTLAEMGVQLIQVINRQGYK